MRLETRIESCGELVVVALLPFLVLDSREVRTPGPLGPKQLEREDERPWETHRLWHQWAALLSHCVNGKFRSSSVLLLLLQTAVIPVCRRSQLVSSHPPSLCSISPQRFPETLSAKTTTRNPPLSQHPNMETYTRTTTLPLSQSVEHPSSASLESLSLTSLPTSTFPLSLISQGLINLCTNT